MKPVYFDLTVEDVEKSKSFFSNVLNWKFHKLPNSHNYFLIQAGEENEPGIDGGIGSINDTEISNREPLTIVTIQVSNIDETLIKIIDNDGKIVEKKREIPGVGLYATCSEPGGLLFGLIQPY